MPTAQRAPGISGREMGAAAGRGCYSGTEPRAPGADREARRLSQSADHEAGGALPHEHGTRRQGASRQSWWPQREWHRNGATGCRGFGPRPFAHPAAGPGSALRPTTSACRLERPPFAGIPMVPLPTPDALAPLSASAAHPPGLAPAPAAEWPSGHRSGVGGTDRAPEQARRGARWLPPGDGVTRRRATLCSLESCRWD